VEYRVHATKRMFQRSIHSNDVDEILNSGKIIEIYEDDFPLPSVLLSGKTYVQRSLHLVVGLNEYDLKLVIITAYEPDSNKWNENFSKRLT